MSKKLKEYHVTWEIDVTASSAVEAAKQAREMQTAEGSMANVFDVTSEDGDTTRVDLEEERT